jgi:hypothetical protein
MGYIINILTSGELLKYMAFKTNKMTLFFLGLVKFAYVIGGDQNSQFSEKYTG